MMRRTRGEPRRALMSDFKPSRLKYSWLPDCGTPGPADIQGHETVPDADLVNILVQQFSEPDCTCPLHTLKYLH